MEIDKGFSFEGGGKMTSVLRDIARKKHCNRDTLPGCVSALYVSGKLSTDPSPLPTLTLTSDLGQNVGLGEGWGGQFPSNV